MNDEFISNEIDKDEYALETEEIDYKNLITKLKDISLNLTLLEKKILR
tara:strand:+ start:173 stop:316 length:144 start_codon:yes stop_codon:yes gene_type:complete